MCKYVKKNMYILLAAIFLWGCSFFVERLFFNKTLINVHNLVYILLKMTLMIVYLAFFKLGSIVYQKLNEKDPYYIFAFQVFISYMMLMTFLLLLVWPGLWRDDEFHIISGCTDFYMNSIQHYLTACMYMLFLMIIPCAGGIVFCEQIIYSLIISYIAYGLVKVMHLKRKWCLFCLIPFIFIPVLDSNLYPMRMCIYAFIEVFFLAITLFQLKKKEINICFLAFYVIACSLLAVWRSEGFYYILVGPLLFIGLFHKKVKNIVTAGAAIAIVFLSIAGIRIQKNLEQEQVGEQTLIISTVNFLHHELNNGRLGKNEKLYKQMDRVVNMSVMKEYGANAIWADYGLIRENYSDEEYSIYKLAYIKLVLRDMDVFLSDRFKQYLSSNAVGNADIFLGTTDRLFDEEVDYEVRMEFKNKPFNMPMFGNLRKRVISEAELLNKTGGVFYIIKVLLYNTVFPLIVLVICCIGLLRRKKFKEGTVMVVSLIKFPLIFALAPASLFMYYYPIYLEGYICIFILLGRYFDIREGKR